MVWRFPAVRGMEDSYDANARAILDGIRSGYFPLVDDMAH